MPSESVAVNERPPYVEGMLEITDFRDAIAALRCDDLITARDKYPDVHFVADTLVSLNGASHLARRRTESRLFSPGALEEYKDEILLPLLGDALSAQYANSAIRKDLVEFASYVTLRLGASVVGLDGAESPEAAKELMHLIDRWSEGTGFVWNKVSGPERQRYFDGLVEDGEILRTQWFQPSLSRREGLVAAVAAGRIDEKEIPNDLLTSLLRSQDLHERRDVIFREAGLYMHASIHTTTRAICYAVDEILEWLERNPSERQITQDLPSLQSAVWEVLRLHPLVPALIRTARAEVVLPSGQRIPEGRDVVIFYGAANRDKSIFGADADTFNPRRVLGDPSVWRYGLSFAAGRHACMGRRMAAGDENLVGTVARVVSALFAAGLQKDHTRSAIPVTETFYGGYRTYPIVLTSVD